MKVPAPGEELQIKAFVFAIDFTLLPMIISHANKFLQDSLR